jgi:hypothetical protein
MRYYIGCIFTPRESNCYFVKISMNEVIIAYRKSGPSIFNTVGLSPRYPPILYPSFAYPPVKFRPLFPYPSSVPFYPSIFNHPKFVNTSHGECSDAARFSPPTILRFFCKPTILLTERVVAWHASVHRQHSASFVSQQYCLRSV